MEQTTQTQLQIEIQEKLQELSVHEITTITLNTDVLKHNFEVLIEILRKLSLKTDANTGSIEGTNKEIRDLRERLERLENKQESDKKELDNKINDINSNLQNVQDKTNENTQNIDKIFDQLKDLRDNQNNLQNSNNDRKCNCFDLYMYSTK